MKWLLSLLATAALGGAAEPPPTVEAEVLLLPGNSCLCGIRGAAVVRNPTRHDARIEVSLVAPPGWMVEPSTLQMTTLAESASMVELKIWTPRRIAVRDYTLELSRRRSTAARWSRGRPRPIAWTNRAAC